MGRQEMEDGGTDDQGPGTWSASHAEGRLVRPPLGSPQCFVKHGLTTLPSLGTGPSCEEDTWLVCFFFHSRLNV